MSFDASRGAAQQFFDDGALERRHEIERRLRRDGEPILDRCVRRVLAMARRAAISAAEIARSPPSAARPFSIH